MNTKIYWKIRYVMNRLVFKLNTFRYRLVLWFEENKRGKLSFAIITSVSFHILLYCLLAVITFFADSQLFKLISQKPETDLNSTIAIIIGGMGIAGVILGLYCSSIATIYSQKYSNAPESISNVFHRDILTNKCIKQITGYIVYSAFLLIECIAIRCPSFISMVVLIILIVRSVITFSITRNRTYQLSDSYRLSLNIYPNVCSCIDKSIRHDFVGTDPSFQAHLHKIVAKQLELLKDISNYNKRNEIKDNTAMVQFMKNNLSLLQYYWEKKPFIPFDSKWFEEKPVYKRWYQASDSEIGICARTGAVISNENKTDPDWFEERVFEINEICIEKLYADKDYPNLYSYVIQVSNTSKYAVIGHAIQFWMTELLKLQHSIVSLCSTEDTKKNEISTGLIDAFCLAYIGVIIEINQTLSSIDLQRLFNCAINMADKGEIGISKNGFYNNMTLKRMLSQTQAESLIEHKRLTPDWCIEQIVAKEIFDYCNEVIETLQAIYSNVLELGTQLASVSHFSHSVTALCRYFELEYKTESTNQILESIIPSLQKKHKETSLKWEDSLYRDYLSFKSSIADRFIDSIIKTSESFAIDNWADREKLPDFLGECYHNICEYLIRAIEENDFTRFNVLFDPFFRLMLLYKESIRCDLVKHKEEYQQIQMYFLFTAPYVEYSKIASYAIVWGEIQNDSRWKNVVENGMNRFLEFAKTQESFIVDFIEVIKAWDNSPFCGGGRGIIHSGWDLRMISAIKRTNSIQYEYGEYGSKTIKTSSTLLRMFYSYCNDNMDFINPIEDVFVVSCVNKLVKPNERYFGRDNWGKKIDDSQ